ncbi:MAG: hypothetical protein WAZ98_10675 [Cyclobacteriaceae bacterium]
MKRSQFVMLGVGGIAALSIPGYYYFFDEVQYDTLLSQPKALSLVWDSHTIGVIGEHYRQQFPEENNKRSLVKALETNGLNGDALELAIQHKIISDFETTNTVMVDGWLLSVTEARQCALFSTTLTS